MVSTWRLCCIGTGFALLSSVAVYRVLLRRPRPAHMLARPTPPAHVVAACTTTFAPPVALIDNDAFAANVASLVAPIRAAGKAVRIATKSIRSVALIEKVRAICEEDCGVPVQGIMTFTAAESLVWARRRTFKDILLGYPIATAAAAYAVILCNVENPTKVRCSVVVDCMAQVELLIAAALEWIDTQEALVNSFDTSVASVTVPLVVDVDMSWRPAGDAVHIGVRRSPLRSAADVATFVRAVRHRAAALAALSQEQQQRRRIGVQLVVVGLMGYEAQIAGLPEHLHDQQQQSSLLSRVAAQAMASVKAAIKGRSLHDAFARRQAMVAAAVEGQQQQHRPNASSWFVNGGGSGSVVATSTDPSVTEVTIGSGVLCGHLFDGFDRNVRLQPCLYFALPVCRVPDAGRFVTVSGGGWVASGPPAADRLPLVVYPPNALRLLVSMEGAGEVQTPLEVLRTHASPPLSVGSVVIFRPAKSGELGEVFTSYRVVSGAEAAAKKLPAAVATYRGDSLAAWA